MNKEDENVERNGNNVTQQFAMIWNYNAHVEHQHNYYGGKEEKHSKTPFIPCELKFFDHALFGSEEKQPKLIEMLNEIVTKIDTTSGRGWFAVYAGYRYFKNQLAIKSSYTDFFADIEQLLPDILTKTDTEKDGDKRYHKYTQLLGREVDAWYMDNGKLPPINEITSWKESFSGEAKRFESSCLVIKEVYKMLKQI